MVIIIQRNTINHVLKKNAISHNSKSAPGKKHDVTETVLEARAIARVASIPPGRPTRETEEAGEE